MKKLVLAFAMLVATLSAIGQNCYWVMLSDKQGTTFDPYTYFDAKAIERYRLCGADLYDISNYPLNQTYVSQVNALATEEVGASRWFNAVAVMATADQVEAIRLLPFVREVVALESNMQLAKASLQEKDPIDIKAPHHPVAVQLTRMGGEHFRAKGIDGKGVRIAVFDGGFPQVNTHVAFQHLRDNHQIIKTWNFPNHRENVYGWSSHGLMTLSCIAGRLDSTDLGLATGAEFLLARTEVETEPFKEEVWWQMAVEWADKNGAQIISSSLGYGKDRYYTRDMNGQSYVAKAGNMAARKGILVCNSAGNEGDDGQWRTIITPADADSVLCVGGIVNSLSDYSHIAFSSYGPTADGRQKPNVVAFGRAHTANTGKSNDKFHYVPGTSFSCPLVAGFAACALQCHPDLKAMDLFHEIEKSADLYPYCDYTYGYGVPQADYFTGDRNPVQPTFRFVKDDSSSHYMVIPTQDTHKTTYLFVKNCTPDGKIIDYRQFLLPYFTSSMWVELAKGCIVTVHYNGYTATCDLRDTTGSAAYGDPDDYLSAYVAGNCDVSTFPRNCVRLSPQQDHHYLDENNYHIAPYFMFGLPIAMNNEMHSSIWSPVGRLGVTWTRYFAKAYGLGFSIEYGQSSYRFARKDEANSLERLLGVDEIVNNADDIKIRRVTVNQFSAEIYQRVRFIPGGMMHKGFYWDLGAYVTTSYNNYRLQYSNNTDLMADRRDLRLHNIYPLRASRLLYGVTTRFTYDIFGIYARYNLQNLGKELSPDEVALPRLEVGLQLVF